MGERKTKIYLVYHPSIREMMERVYQKTPFNILASYYFLKDNPSVKFDYILDSGAFSAFNSGKTILLEEYMTFIREHEPKVYFNLDDITSPERTMVNQEKMEREGFNPVPVFHVNEDWRYLDDLIERGYDYIAVGGMVPYSQRIRKLACWLSLFFDKTPSKVKVHGFGISSLKIVRTFPFYSVDSSSFSTGGRYGVVYFFEKGRIKQKKVKVDSEYNKLLNYYNLLQWLKIDEVRM